MILSPEATSEDIISRLHSSLLAHHPGSFQHPECQAQAFLQVLHQAALQGPAALHLVHHHAGPRPEERQSTPGPLGVVFLVAFISAPLLLGPLSQQQTETRRRDDLALTSFLCRCSSLAAVATAGDKCMCKLPT
mmetsp:Transcript_62208/g.148415  ORF Transcript_62208/g.148415 Transcript_62208/m.148415 type:complete len:134 (+) Transcript_62208:94-495(+)|eukprot:CAMPEP_0178431118 /NCGR_PEP_ID=MMETSP0689_2-20121128/31673_1 /TAXON_ID=160604 /ORGANISM="Amphidinium massartii, Strain CS-259" /LENGTH=133 /DNA_ID=CAMNT_0020053001 /DNA_START=93 /DNA_END=494 /DNA_ORIENTATION=-